MLSVVSNLPCERANPTAINPQPSNIRAEQVSFSGAMNSGQLDAPPTQPLSPMPGSAARLIQSRFDHVPPSVNEGFAFAPTAPLLVDANGTWELIPDLLFAGRCPIARAIPENARVIPCTIPIASWVFRPSDAIHYL